MRIIFEKEEMADYENIMTKIACLLYLESKKALMELNKRDISTADTDAIGLAAGQILYDDIIELTEDMSREELVKFFAQSSIAFQIKNMNDDAEYRHEIMSLTDNLSNNDES